MIASPTIFTCKDPAGRYLLDNKSHRQLLGVTSLDQVLGKTVFDLFPREVAERFAADDRMVLESGQPLVNREEPITDWSGRQGWVSTTKVPWRAADQTIVGLVCISRDISPRKQAEAAVEYERHLLHTLLDHVPDIIYFKDLESRFLRINRAFATQAGFLDPAEAVGRTNAEFTTPENSQRTLRDELEVIRSGLPIINKEEKQTWADGRVRGCRPPKCRSATRTARLSARSEFRETSAIASGPKSNCDWPRKPPKPPLAPKAISWPT